MSEGRQLEGFSKYIIYDDGQIFSKSYKRFMKTYINHNGYRRIHLYADNGSYKNMKVSRLVALAFIPNEDQTRNVVGHKDADRANDRVENLHWITQKENMNEANAPDNVRASSHHGQRQPVAQYDKDGNYISSYESMAEAARALGVHRTQISIAVRENRTIRGFHFERI